MNEWEFHPASNLFPMLDEKDLKELSNDIKENGQDTPIAIYDGKILDGRNRYKACKMAHIEPKFVYLNGEVKSPYVYVASKNLHRRHLTPSQRGAIGAEIAEAILKERQVKANKPKELRSTSPSGDGVAVEIAAKIMDVGKSTIERALRVKRKDPEKFQQIKDGKITASSADAPRPKKEKRRGFRRDKTAPYIVETEGQRRIALAQKSKMEATLSTIKGACKGLDELDVQMTLAVLSHEEIKTWQKISMESSKILRKLSSKLGGKRK